MDGIFVVTHNGKPPSEGGRRLGYQVGSLYQSVAGGPMQFVGKPIVRAAPQGGADSSEIYYDNLPLVGPGMFRSCFGCKSSSAVNPTKMKTDQGVKQLYRCGICGTLMRPRT